MDSHALTEALRHLREAEQRTEFHVQRALEWTARAQTWREEIRRQIVQASRNG